MRLRAERASTLALTEDDRCLNVMPLFHIHGLVGVVLASVWAGGSVVCTAGFHAPSFLDSLEEWAPTWYSAVPTMHQAVLARASDSGSRPTHALRFIRSSSAALPVPVLDGLESTFGVPVIEAYGMTEAAHQMTSNRLPPHERKRGSVGQAAGPEITVLGPDGVEVPRGEVGEVAIRGENVFGGYAGDPQATAQAFSGSWFRTGDEGRLDEAGHLFLQGRIKEIINRAGEKISPAEVEAVLLEHPRVAQATVFAVPDELLGEDVGAAVVLAGDGPVAAQELQAFAAQQLADFKMPRVVTFVDEIPKGPTGKVQRIGLAARLGISAPQEPARADYAPPRSAIELSLVEMVGDVLGVERVGIADDFFSLGGDSLLAAELWHGFGACTAALTSHSARSCGHQPSRASHSSSKRRRRRRRGRSSSRFSPMEPAPRSSSSTRWTERSSATQAWLASWTGIAPSTPSVPAARTVTRCLTPVWRRW